MSPTNETQKHASHPCDATVSRCLLLLLCTGITHDTRTHKRFMRRLSSALPPRTSLAAPRARPYELLKAHFGRTAAFKLQGLRFFRAKRTIRDRPPTMSHNTFGHLFRVTTWGESHGPAIGCVVDGCPPGIPLIARGIQSFLDKRKPGQSRFTTQRREADRSRSCRACSPTTSGRQVTTGTPISLHDRNDDQRSKDYGDIKDKFRPGHADYHVLGEIRHPRLPRRRALLGARDGDARRRRRHRP